MIVVVCFFFLYDYINNSLLRIYQRSGSVSYLGIAAGKKRQGSLSLQSALSISNHAAFETESHNQVS